jgi:large subunit ribosomal protein L20
MPRAKTGVVRRRHHKKLLHETRGYQGVRSRLYRKAKETALNAGEHSYADRKKKKGDFRRLWIVRINAAAQQNGLRYSELIHGLKLQGVELDRKIMADLAARDPQAFAALSQKAKAAVSTQT